MKNNTKKDGVRLVAFMALSCAVLFSVITFIIEPVSVFALSDITVRDTLLPNIIDIIRDLAENAAFAFCYSAIIYAAVKRSTRAAWGLLGIYALGCLLRRACVLLMTYITYSYIDATDILSVCAALLFEYILALAVTLFSVNIGKGYRTRTAQTEKAARIKGDLSLVPRIEFDSVFSKDNPLELCALIAGILLSAVRIAMRIETDIKYTLVYGAPSIGEILIMIVYYMSDILVCAIFYALSWYILSRLTQKERNT